MKQAAIRVGDDRHVAFLDRVLPRFVDRARTVEQHSLLKHQYFGTILNRDWAEILIEDPEWDGEDDLELFPRLPSKEQFESAVGRVRPLILKRDDVNIGKVIQHLSAYLGGRGHGGGYKELESRWNTWWSEEIGVASREDFRGVGLNGRHVSYGVLGKAWLYGEYVHADSDAQSVIGDMPSLATYISALSHYCPLMDIAVKLLGVIREEQSVGVLGPDFRPLRGS